MLAAAATEGAGLVLLVPMLAALGGGPAEGLAERLAAIGVPIDPAALLALFALVRLRERIVYARSIVGQSFEAALVDGLRSRAWSALLHCEWRTLAGGGSCRAESASGSSWPGLCCVGPNC